MVGLACFATSISVALDNYENASFVKYEEPIFPPGLKFDGITDGHVELMIDINEDGTVADWIALRSTHPRLTESVARAMKNWKFKPATYNGEKIPVAQRLMINFDHSGTVLISGTGLDLHNRWLQRLGKPDDRLAFQLPDLDQLPEPTDIIRPMLPISLAENTKPVTVMVSFYIDETGTVRIPVVTEWEVDILYAKSAIQAITQWKFKPPKRKGRPVVVHAIQPFHFKPGNKGN